MRLDKELVIRNFAPTRTKAQELIKNNFVLINGKIINKTGHELNDKDIIEIKTNDITVFITGEHAQHVIPLCSSKYRYIPNLTLYGLYCIYKNNIIS